MINVNDLDKPGSKYFAIFRDMPYFSDDDFRKQRAICVIFMPPPLGAGGIMFSGCASVRQSLKYPLLTCTWDSAGFFAHLLSQIYLNSYVDASFICGDLNCRFGGWQEAITEVDDIPAR